MDQAFRAFWWSNPCVPAVFNFGDLLTPILMRHYCKDTKILAGKKETAVIYGVGSLIRAIDPKKFSVILGCGNLSEEKISLPKARVYACRGINTKKMLGIDSTIPMGDPGLLMPYALPLSDLKIPTIQKPIGIIPHFKQYAYERLDPYRFDPRFKVINVRAEAKCVIREICSCSAVISSSLHGLIIADAYKIPNIRLSFGDNLSDVDDYKYSDYFSSIGRSGDAAKCITVSEISSFSDFDTSYFDNIEKAQKNLDAAFRKFAAETDLIKTYYQVDLVLREAKRIRLETAQGLEVDYIKLINKEATSEEVRNLLKRECITKEIQDKIKRYRRKRLFAFRKNNQKIKEKVHELENLLSMINIATLN